MNTAKQYARALFALIQDPPAGGPKDGKIFLRNLNAVLLKRGHQKLLPRIFIEYKKLHEGRERSEVQKTVTKEQERTRVLLELYRTLTKTA